MRKKILIIIIAVILVIGGTVGGTVFGLSRSFDKKVKPDIKAENLAKSAVLSNGAKSLSSNSDLSYWKAKQAPALRLISEKM